MTKIKQMAVNGLNNMIDRAFRSGGPHQFLRELMKNSIESGATEVQISPEWKMVKKDGVYRLCFADNGSGMEPDELFRYINTIGLSSKSIGGYHENFGMGARVSTLPWNRDGVLVMTRTERSPAGAAVRLAFDRTSKAYGAVVHTLSDGTKDYVVPLDDPGYAVMTAMMPRLCRSHGTVVILYGNKKSDDTFFGPRGYSSEDGLKYIHKYLNQRFWQVPIKVRATCFFYAERDRWPTSPASDMEADGLPRRAGASDAKPLRIKEEKHVSGMCHFVTASASKGHKANVESGRVAMKDGTVIEWFYRHDEKPPENHAWGAPENGLIAVCYENELYDARSHASTFRSFGIFAKEVAKRTTLVIHPPAAADDVDGGVFPDASRNILYWKVGLNGVALPWNEWQDEFRQKLPDVIVKALQEKAGTNENTIDPATLREIEERVKSRLKKLVWILDRDRDEPPDPEGPGPDDADKTNKSRRPPPTGDKRKEKPGALPPFEWITMDEMGETRWPVRFERPSPAVPAGKVSLAKDHPAFLVACQELLEVTPDHAADMVVKMLQDHIGLKVAVWIARSNGFAREWTRQEVAEHLWSDDALTAVFCPDFADEAQLRGRIARKVGTLGDEKPSPSLVN
jgi:hypothetical protein